MRYLPLNLRRNESRENCMCIIIIERRKIGKKEEEKAEEGQLVGSNKVIY